MCDYDRTCVFVTNGAPYSRPRRTRRPPRRPPWRLRRPPRRPWPLLGGARQKTDTPLKESGGFEHQGGGRKHGSDERDGVSAPKALPAIPSPQAGSSSCPLTSRNIAPQTEHRIYLPADLRCDITMAGRGCAREVRRGLTARRRGCWRLAIKTTHLASKKPGRARVGYDSDRRPFDARNASGLRIPSSSCPWACAWACPSYCCHRRRLYRWHR